MNASRSIMRTAFLVPPQEELTRKVRSKVFVFFSFCFLLVQFGFAQDFKTELRFVDVSNGYLSAGLNATQIQKSQFDYLMSKLGGPGYSVTQEFTEAKKCGAITIKSNGKSELKELQTLLTQAGIFQVFYNGKVIATHQIEANYVPVNRTEVKRFEKK